MTGTIPMPMRRACCSASGSVGGGATKSAGPISCVFFVTGFMIAIV